MIYFCKKKQRGRETKVEDDLEEQWFGGSVPFKGWDHLTDPQICLNLKIVDEYLPWTVSSLNINGWKIKYPFGMAIFRGELFVSGSVMLSPGNLTTTESHLVILISMGFRVCWLWLRFLNCKTPWCDWKLQLTGSKFLHHSQETCAQTLCPLNSIVNTSVNLGLVARGSHLHTTTSEVASE